MKRKLYGLFDMKDQVWIGDDKGPWTHTDRNLVRLAAETRSFALGWPLTRIRARRYVKPVVLVKRDDVTKVKTDKQVKKYLERLGL